MLREDVRGSGSGAGDEPDGVDLAPTDLARSLTFIRASNLQVMRLELARERQDRRGVMAAMDELVGLDRELGRFIESIPHPALNGIGRELEAQKREMIEQRLVLARGKTGPVIAPAAARQPARPVIARPVAQAAPATAPTAAAAHQAYEPDWRLRWVVAALLVAALAIAAFLLFGGGAIEALLATWERPA